MSIVAVTEQGREMYERRVATLRRLGAKIVEITCRGCGGTFVDPVPLGGRTWRLVVVTNDGGDRMSSRPFCSEQCAKDAFDKHPGSGWIEGYEPPEPSRPRNR